MFKPTARNPPLPEWEQVLSAAAHLQRILPDAVLVGGTASAMHAHHSFSRDADHVLTDRRSRFDAVLAELESVAGWKTARVQRPVQILGSLDGIETGIRQLIREAPLETIVVEHLGASITVPTAAEILRIKGVLILKRNATPRATTLTLLPWLTIWATQRCLRPCIHSMNSTHRPMASHHYNNCRCSLRHPCPTTWTTRCRTWPSTKI